jgi:hypothetical protein
VQQPRISRRHLLGAGMATAGAAAIGPRVLAIPEAFGLTEPETSSAAVPVSAPAIISRAEWGADESIGNRGRDFAPLTKAVLHHTAIAEGADAAAQVRGIHRSHVLSNGWSDIGYNFLVDRAGRIYEGRWARDYAPGEVHTGESTSGRIVTAAHATSHNTGTMGIAVLGNYSSTADVTAASLGAVARLIAWKFGPRALDPHGSSPYVLSNGQTSTFANICGHRDVVGTDCPGGALWPKLPSIRDMVAAELQRGLVGFRILGAEGSLWTYGAVPSFSTAADIGDVRRNVGPGVPVRSAVGTPAGRGAWVADVNGSVYSFGDAAFLGSMGGKRLNRPIVSMASTPSGAGYWLVATDGGIFSFGDAAFHGSTGAMRLNQPIVGMASTPSGAGYWLVASDGGIFSFGDARFFGSTGDIRLVQPIVDMATAPDGQGYWLLAADGGIFNFGSAPFLGSAVGRSGFRGPATSLATTPTGQGYWVLDSTGAVHGFGDAPVFGGGVTAGSRPALALVPVVRP